MPQSATALALKRAEAQVGYRETGDNDNKFGKYYGLNHEAWCAMFVSWCFATSRNPLPVFQPGMKSGYAGVCWGISFAKSHGLWINSWQAQPGDAICYGWVGPHSPPEQQHTGLVVSSGKPGSVGHTIEGNRGDQVERQTFVVGADTVLGCINLNKLMDGPEKIVIKPHKPEPQPGHPDHPHHTGPPAADHSAATPLEDTSRLAVALLNSKLPGRTHPLMQEDRKSLTELVTQVERVRNL